jgi:plasmid maintenance system antidote protein VapI
MCRMTLANASRRCDSCHTMPKPKKKQPPTMSDVLRQTILESGIPLLALSKATGVQRASISRFVSQSQSLRLDCADKLAAHFGLVLKQEEAE